MNSFVINWSSAADRSEENCCQLDSQRALLFLQPLRGLINAPTPPTRRPPAAATRAWPGTLTHTLLGRPPAHTHSPHTHLRGCGKQSTLLHILLAIGKSQSIEFCHFETGNNSEAVTNPRLSSGQAVNVDKLSQHSL